MRMWTIPLAVVSVAALVAAARPTWAGSGGDLHARLARLMHGEACHGDAIEAHLDLAAATLELSAAQRKEVGSVLTAGLPNVEARALALVEAHARQFERVHAREFDEAALRAASRQVGTAQEELAVAAARLLSDAHGVLTPEQRERLTQLPRPDLFGRAAEHVRGIARGARAWADRQ